MRVRMCVKCKEYVPIHPDNVLSLNVVSDFEFRHSKHPVQTIDKREVPEGYNRNEVYASEI